MSLQKYINIVHLKYIEDKKLYQMYVGIHT